MSNWSPSFTRKIIAIFDKVMTDKDQRRALFIRAFGNGHPLLTLLNFPGSISDFNPIMVVKLDEFGESEPGIPALVALLEVVKSHTGIDKGLKIDEVMAELRESPVESPDERLADLPIEYPELAGWLQVMLQPEPQVWAFIVDSYWRQSQYWKNVVECGEKVLNLQPDNEWARTRTIKACKTLLETGYENRDCHIYCRSMLIKIEPTYDEYVKRAELYIADKKIELAIADYTHALDFEGDKANLFRARANLYEKIGDLDAAILDWGRLLEFTVDKDKGEIYHERAALHEKKRDFDSAILEYDSIINHDPLNIYNYIKRGQLYTLKGDSPSAIKYYTELLESEKFGDKSSQLLSARAQIYEKEGNLDAALADLTQIIEFYPNKKSAYDVRRAFYMRNRQFDLADKDYKEYRKLPYDELDDL